MESKYFLRFILFNTLYFIGERFELNFSYKKAKYLQEKKIFKIIEIFGYCI